MQFNLISDLDKEQHISLNERGLHYGDGLFETMLLENNTIRYWPEHYQRLNSCAQKLLIKCPSKAWFEQQLEPYFALKQNLIIKIILTRGSGGRGLQLPEEGSENIYILHYKYNKPDKIQSVKADISQITLPSNRMLSGIKHLNRLNYILATDELTRKPQYNESLLLNESGHVIESLVNNLFFVLHNTLCTPDLTLSGVDGIMRQHIIKKMKQQQKEVKIGDYSRDDVMSADECFLCNSVQGIRPLIQIENKNYPIGPITQSLQQEFHGTQSY